MASKKRKSSYEFHGSETVLVQDGRALERIIGRMAFDLNHQRIVAGEDVFNGAVEYFGRFKLSFANEVMLPPTHLSGSEEDPESVWEGFLDRRRPTNMPWCSERMLFRITGKTDYFDVLKNGEREVFETALYWILEDLTPVWNVFAFVWCKDTGRWELCPFDSSVVCLTDPRTGYGYVQSISHSCMYTQKVIDVGSVESGEKRRQTRGLRRLVFGLRHCLACLTELNFGGAYLEGRSSNKQLTAMHGPAIYRSSVLSSS